MAPTSIKFAFSFALLLVIISSLQSNKMIGVEVEAADSPGPLLSRKLMASAGMCTAQNCKSDADCAHNRNGCTRCIKVALFYRDVQSICLGKNIYNSNED